MLFKIIPAILTESEEDLRKKIRILENLTDRVHIDIIDGVFAVGKTVSLTVFSQIKTNLFLDVHLMVDKPLSWLEECSRFSVNRVIGQIELMASQQDFVTKVTEVGLSPGLAVDLETGLEALDKKALLKTKTVLLMGVKAGFGGQKLDRRIFLKIEKLKKLKEEGGFPFKIMVDGGLKEENILEIVRSGAEELAIGSAILGQKDPTKAMKRLEELTFVSLG